MPAIDRERIMERGKETDMIGLDLLDPAIFMAGFTAGAVATYSMLTMVRRKR